MALTDNLISYWKLDESSGNADDAVSTNDLTNANVSYTTGKINNGAVFNQTTNKLQVNSNLGINGGSCSISLWAKMSANPASGFDDFFFLTANSTSKANYNIYYENNSGTLQLSFSRGRDNVGDQIARTNVDLGTTNWHHCVLTYDGTNIEGYLDGTSIGTAAASGNGTGPATGNVSLIGAWTYNGNYGNYHKGMIDEVGVWSRALSSTEVTALYNSGNGLQYPFVTNLTLAVDTMALTLTYASVTLTKAIKLVVDTMALSFTFADVMFNNALTLIVDTMALSLTYADVTLKKAVKLVVDTMSLVLSFKDVVLRKIGWDYDTKPTTSWTNDDK